MLRGANRAPKCGLETIDVNPEKRPTCICNFPASISTARTKIQSVNALRSQYDLPQFVDEYNMLSSGTGPTIKVVEEKSPSYSRAQHDLLDN
jgi:hypothetical protein